MAGSADHVEDGGQQDREGPCHLGIQAWGRGRILLKELKKRKQVNEHKLQAVVRVRGK